MAIANFMYIKINKGVYMKNQAIVPSLTNHFPVRNFTKVINIFLGVTLVASLAQVSIPLPWTPVPITGQTFGVSLLALLWGSRLASISFLTYLGVGFLGAPVFASGKSGFLIGPTFGYLIGMLIASYVLGYISERGACNGSLLKTLGVCYIGSAITFTFGLIVLSIFIPRESLLIAGLYPFLIGDFFKNSLAALIFSKMTKDKIN